MVTIIITQSMSEQEKTHSQGAEKQPEREQERLYYQAARFTQEQQARAIYVTLQDTIYQEPCDLSAYRFLLEDIAHIAVLGSQPSAELDERLQAMLAVGEPASLPPDVLQILDARRKQAAQHGSWVEGHYRPGKHIRRPKP